METAFLVKHPLSLGVKAMSKHLLSAVARAALVAEDDAFERLLLFLCLFCLGLVRRNHPTLTSLLDVYTFACVCVCVLYLGLCVLNMERRSRGGEGGRKREEEGRREGGRRRRKEKRGEDESSSSTTKQAVLIFRFPVWSVCVSPSKHDTQRCRHLGTLHPSTREENRILD